MLKNKRRKGKHRGIYQPSPHWSHKKCYPDGMCLFGIREITLIPYMFGEHKTIFDPSSCDLPQCQTLTFTEAE